MNACHLLRRQVSGKRRLPHGQPSYSTINGGYWLRAEPGGASTAWGRRPGFLWNASVKGYQGNRAGNYCNTTKDFNWDLIKPGKAHTWKGEASIFLQHCGNWEFPQPRSLNSKSTQITLLRLPNVAIFLQNLADLQLITYQGYEYKQISLKK